MYKARSWENYQHVIVKVEANTIGTNIRYKVTTRDKCNFIAIFIMAANNKLPDFYLVWRWIVQREPTERPGHFCPGKCFRYGIPECHHPQWGMKTPFILTDIFISQGFDLVHPDNRIECQKPMSN